MAKKRRNKNNKKAWVTHKRPPIKKKQFYNGKEIEKYDAEFNVILGGRDIGKSYYYKLDKGKKAWESNCFLGVMFRHKDDKNAEQIGDYFDDVVEEMTNGEADKIKARGGKLFGYKNDKKVKQLGYYFYLSEYDTYKSGVFNKVKWLIMEEFVAEEGKKGYLLGETVKFDNMVSTIFRIRFFIDNCKVYLIGNTITDVTPYTHDWDLKGIMTQDFNTIDIYERNFYNEFTAEYNNLHIAVELLPDLGTNETYALTEDGRRMDKGGWAHGKGLNISKEYLAKCVMVHEFIMVELGFYYYLRLYHDNKGNYFIYCVPKTTKIKDNIRIIGNYNTPSMLHTRTLIPIIEKERFVFNLLDQGKVAFCDGKTGKGFKQVYDAIKRAR